MRIEPDCYLGISCNKLIDELGLDEYKKFMAWMTGQTMAICEGQRFDHSIMSWVPTCNMPHGPVVYVWDFERYVKGLPIID